MTNNLLKLLLLAATISLGKSLLATNWISPTVCTWHAGCMTGRRLPGYRIDSFEAFMGIPFAKPPVGELRFSHPQPYPRWHGILKATEPKPDCVQKNALIRNGTVEGVEDCLYLNVYRPKPDLLNVKKMTVMVYIYGGGFFAGSANPGIVGPEYIMDTEDVILVTIAYRLGIFGFLSTNDSVVPGNFGLKDQTLALKWVQKNIADFGGDPKQVTIFGQSAGGLSCHMHMLSQHSEGLFQRVISLSGTANVPLGLQEAPLRVARLTAEHCNIENATNLSSSQLLEALRQVDVKTLMAAADSIKYWDTHPITLFCPVVENFNSPDAFLTEHPLRTMASGNYKAVPFMTGVVAEEGAFRSANIWEFEDLRNSFNADFDNLLELFLQFPLHFDRARLDAAMERIIGEYFDGHHELTKQGILDVASDRVFLHPFYHDTKTFVNTIDTSKYPLHLYFFNYRGPYSYTSIYTGGLPHLDYGVVHGDELIYLFRSPVVFPDFPKNSTPAKVSQTLVGHFVDFATNRESTPSAVCNMANYPQNSMDTICDYVSFENGPTDTYVVRTDNKFNLRRLHMWDEILQE